MELVRSYTYPYNLPLYISKVRHNNAIVPAMQAQFVIGLGLLERGVKVAFNKEEACDNVINV